MPPHFSFAKVQTHSKENVFKFPTMSREEKLNHVKILEKLLDKQKVLYTRLSLSDDPEAIKMKERISESASMMGLPSNVDMNVIFKNMSSMLQVMKEQIDKTGSDI